MQKFDDETSHSWNLKDLYTDIYDKSFDKDIKTALSYAQKFEKKYKTNLQKLSPEDFFFAIKEYEQIITLIDKTGAFAFLTRTTNLTDDEIKAFESKVNDLHTTIGRHILFFELEINKLSDKNIEEKLENKKTKKYSPWIEKLRKTKRYQLEDEVEKVLHEKSQTGRASWVKFYSELKARMSFVIDDKKLTEAELMSFFSHPDEKRRKKAGKEYGKVTKEYNWQLATIVNNVVKDKKIEDDLRGFKTPISSRNLTNEVEEEVVLALVDTVKNNYKETSHRFYKIKAKMLGKEKLEYWDRNAPLKNIETKKYSYEEAKEIVYSAYKEFDDEIAEIGKKFFDNNWIDVFPKKGKRGGAFSCSTTIDCHPYIMLNYTKKARDVTTLAHELGHGIHQYLAKEKGALLANTPLTLAETASVFGEMIVFDYMLKNQTDEKQKLALLMGKAQDMINTSIRQIAFHNYEYDVHMLRQEKELSVSDFNEIWTKHMKESLGDYVKISPEASCLWGQVPHCIRSPFYVYAYAFGDNLVNSLYKLYKEKKVPEFEKKYKEILKKGGTQQHKELLAPMGLDASNKDFWQKGIDVLIKMIDEIELITKNIF